ncbi:MAG: hypothetical protein IK039_01255 [Bacteroidaceae bacterium]|nr:hypothetical protein [Bacteroidaceae bacterium]
MKKKMIILASVAMLSIGAAFYANKSSYINALSENDVEALSSTGEGGTIEYTETEDYIIFHTNNKLLVKHGVNKTRWGQTINTCKDGGAGCLIDLGNQTTSEQSENSSWANQITEWVISAAKDVVVSLINRKGN